MTTCLSKWRWQLYSAIVMVTGVGLSKEIYRSFNRLFELQYVYAGDKDIKSVPVSSLNLFIQQNLCQSFPLINNSTAACMEG